MKSDISTTFSKRPYYAPELFRTDNCLQYNLLEDSGIDSGVEDDWGVF